jgi:hypothetical protein
MLWIVLLLAGMVVFSTYVHSAATRARAELAGRRRFRVAFKLAGSGMATRAEMRERLAFEEEITRRSIGAIIDSGSGDGVMWVEIALGASQSAAEQIRDAIAAAGLAERAEVAEVVSG